MTTLECLQHLMDCTGDCEADPELKEMCAKIRSILEAVELLDKFHSALSAPRDFPVYPLMPAENARLGYWSAKETNEYLKKILACS